MDVLEHSLQVSLAVRQANLEIYGALGQIIYVGLLYIAKIE